MVNLAKIFFPWTPSFRIWHLSPPQDRTLGLRSPPPDSSMSNPPDLFFFMTLSTTFVLCPWRFLCRSGSFFLPPRYLTLSPRPCALDYPPFFPPLGLGISPSPVPTFRRNPCSFLWSRSNTCALFPLESSSALAPGSASSVRPFCVIALIERVTSP